MLGNFDLISLLKLGMAWTSFTTLHFGKFCYFYNLYIIGYFHSNNHSYVLWGKCKVILTLFTDWIWVMSDVVI